MKRTIINPVIKDTATFIQTSADSGGEVTAIEITLMPGGSNPLHYHKTYSETFTTIEGELGLKIRKKGTKTLKSGESYTVEPMKAHAFFNATDKPVKFKVELKPGHQGFENSIRILYGLAGDGLTNKKSVPKSLKHTALIACMSDMNLPGLFTLLFPVLRGIAKKAKDRGEEEKLIKRYCR